MIKNSVFNTKTYINTLEALVNIKSEYFHEEEIFQYIYNRLVKKNIKVQIHEYHDEKITGFKGKNLIGRMGNPNAGPKILLNAHVDTVNLVSGWTYSPHKMTVEENRAYGLGTCDMKSGVAAILLALEELSAHETEMKGEIIFSFVSDEEGPFGLGTNYLIHDQLINDADVAIVTEPSSAFSQESFPNICLGARGGTSYRVDFYGKAAHAANPQFGVSAIKDAAKVIEALDQIELKDDGVLGKGTNCVIDFKGGGDACSVAQHAYFKVFRHMVIGESNDTVYEEIDTLIRSLNLKSDYKITFRKGPTKDSDGFMPYVVDPNDDYVRKFIEVVTNTTEKDPNFSYFSSIGDFNYLGSRLNIPVIVFGADGGNYHSADEWVDIPSAVTMTKTVYEYLVEMLL
jgi:succinyl-diaminopimelate desuccinylase